MKLSDFLIDVGRPVAYYPKLKKILGSTNATIFFCQLFYWEGKQWDKEGWIYKNSDDITDETGLSYKEQVTAREKLRDLKVLEERYRKLEHRMYFRINKDSVNELWEGRELPKGRQGTAGQEGRETPRGNVDIDHRLPSDNTSKNKNGEDESSPNISSSLSDNNLPRVAENYENVPARAGGKKRVKITHFFSVDIVVTEEMLMSVRSTYEADWGKTFPGITCIGWGKNEIKYAMDLIMKVGSVANAQKVIDYVFKNWAVLKTHWQWKNENAPTIKMISKREDLIVLAQSESTETEESLKQRKGLNFGGKL